MFKICTNAPQKTLFNLCICCALMLLCHTRSQAQCSEIGLNTLQSIQKADAGNKETQILEAGFDLRNGVTKQGVTCKIYTRCWVTSIKQQSFFDQKIVWNQTDNTLKFATLNDAHYRQLRKTLDERHPESIGATVIRGKLFTYYFGVEKMDGIDYYTLTIAGG